MIFRLRPDPPGRPVVAAMRLGVGGRQRRLADAAQPVQRRDGDDCPTAFFSQALSPRSMRPEPLCVLRHSGISAG